MTTAARYFNAWSSVSGNTWKGLEGIASRGGALLREYFGVLNDSCCCETDCLVVVS